jgi:hypothetical protein
MVAMNLNLHQCRNLVLEHQNNLLELSYVNKLLRFNLIVVYSVFLDYVFFSIVTTNLDVTIIVSLWDTTCSGDMHSLKPPLG